MEHVFQTATVTPTHDEEPGAALASEQKAATMLRADFGLTQREVDGLLALARGRAREALPESLEAARAQQVHLLEDAARRAGSSLSIRDEVAARRALISAAGITRSDPEDVLQGFISVVRKVSARRDQLGPADEPLQLLPPEGPRVIEPEEPDDGDADALSDFDRENPPA